VAVAVRESEGVRYKEEGRGKSVDRKRAEEKKKKEKKKDMGHSFSRCVPGFSIIALLWLLFFGFFDGSRVLLALWVGLGPGAVALSSSQGAPGTLNIAQKLFVVYSCLVHFSTICFTVRLSWALHWVYYESKAVLQRRFWHQESASSGPTHEDVVDVDAAAAWISTPQHGGNDIEQDRSLLG
jgi:hypothetical protein